MPSRPEGRPAVSAADVRKALASPGFYAGIVSPGSGAAASVEVRETHISWVFLIADRAFKLKKPLTLPFLDYGSPQQRHEMCREEVRINRRLAPDLYLGVRAVLNTPDGLRLGSEHDPDAVDYLVEMARYDEADTLAAQLASGELRVEQIRALGRLLARFHQEAARMPDADLARSTERVVMANLHELLSLVEQRAEVERVMSLERFAHAFLAAHAASINARSRRGLVRSGHGDLRADHVLLAEPMQVVDGIEFDRELRDLDVADDLSFLVMDLEARGGARFANALVAAYRQAGGDPGSDSLLGFYACHRALVRAKVALLRARQQRPVSSEHGHESVTARDLLAVAERFSWRARTPLVIVVCGLPAAGKSRLATRLAALSGLPHLNSDVTRKRLAGLEPWQHAAPDAYTPAFSRRTYTALGREAANRVAGYGGAVVDATFRHRADRLAFQRGFGGAAPPLFVECIAPLGILRQRAVSREQEPGGVSDASLSVVERESGGWEALDEIPPDSHLILRSDRDVEIQVSEFLGLLDGRLAWLAERSAALAR